MMAVVQIWKDVQFTQRRVEDTNKKVNRIKRKLAECQASTFSM